jgi:DNA-binding beta-propeller fold protein YncE
MERERPPSDSTSSQATPAARALRCVRKMGPKLDTHLDATMNQYHPHFPPAGWHESTAFDFLASALPITCIRLGEKPEGSRWRRSRSCVCALIVVLALLLTGLLNACGGGGGGGSQQSIQPTSGGSGSALNPVPTIAVLYPSCAPAGEQFIDGVDDQLEVVWQSPTPSPGVLAGSVVRWNGSDRPTASNGSVNALTAQISASDIAAAGTAAVTIFDPPPGGGSSDPLTFTITPGAVDPQSIVVDPAGRFAYALNGACSGGIGGYVSMYTINPTTKTLASIGPPVWTYDPDSPGSMAINPSGTFVYVVTPGDPWSPDYGAVAMYTVDTSTGALTYTGSISGNCPGLCFPLSVAVDPSGKFAYVTTYGSNAVYMFTIDATTGALTSVGTIAAGTDPICVAVDTAGKFAYVVNEGGSAANVSMYAINGTTGALTSIGTIAAGTDPVSVAVDPSGKFAYVTNSGSNNVSMYTINATTGALTSVGTIAAGTDPVSVAVDPSGKFAYVVNSGSSDVSMYTINSTSGSLTLIGTIAAGPTPTSIAIHPSGNLAYVTNSGANDVSMYSIGSTGTLTLVGTIGT